MVFLQLGGSCSGVAQTIVLTWRKISRSNRLQGFSVWAFAAGWEDALGGVGGGGGGPSGTPAGSAPPAAPRFSRPSAVDDPPQSTCVLEGPETITSVAMVTPLYEHFVQFTSRGGSQGHKH